MVSNEVTNRYHRLATMRSGIVWKVREYIATTIPVSSNTEIVEANEDVFSIEIVSLPVGGMITLMAWGRTIRRIVWSLLMPSDWAASVWPSSTDRMPART